MVTNRFLLRLVCLWVLALPVFRVQAASSCIDEKKTMPHLMLSDPRVIGESKYNAVVASEDQSALYVGGHIKDS